MDAEWKVIWLPEALERKYPQAGQGGEWQWFWPSRGRSTDPRTGVRRRHHVQDATFQHFVRFECKSARTDVRGYDAEHEVDQAASGEGCLE